MLQKSTKTNDFFNGFSIVCTVIEGWCRRVVRLNLLPKAAYLEERGRGVVRLNLLPLAAYLDCSVSSV